MGSRFRDPSDPSSLWDDGSPEPEPQPRRKPTSKGWQPRQEKKYRQRVEVTGRQSGKSSRTKPAEVSERVWGLTEHWLERGTAALGKRPPMVNQAEFAKRLDAVIKTDRPTVKLLRQRGPDHLNDIVSRMIDIFWAEIEKGEEHGVHQMLFLDVWGSLLDRAQTQFMVDWLKVHGEAQEYAPVAREDNAYLQVRDAQHMRNFIARVQEETEPPAKPASDSLNRFRTK